MPFTVKDTFDMEGASDDGSLGIGRRSLGVGDGRRGRHRHGRGCPDQQVTPG